MRPRRARAALPALLLLAAGGAAAAERRARFEGPACAVELEEREREPVLMLRPACALDLATTERALRALLRELFPDGRIARVKSVSLGRIESLPWLSERLAAAALRAPGWDARTGRAREGSAERFVGELLRSEGLARELVAVLASFGARAEIAGVEKVLVRGAPGARAPFDAQLWLRLAPE